MTRRVLHQIADQIRQQAAHPASEAPSALFSPSSDYQIDPSVDLDRVERLADQLAGAALARLTAVVPDSIPDSAAARTMLQACAYTVLVETLQGTITADRATANAVCVRFVEIFHEGVAGALELALLKAGTSAGAN